MLILITDCYSFESSFGNQGLGLEAKAYMYVTISKFLQPVLKSVGTCPVMNMSDFFLWLKSVA